MNTEPNAMASITSDGFDQIEPHHGTKTIRGIEVDTGICDLIEFLWDHGFETLRSCENINGFVYIAFRTVTDALNAGLMVAAGFKLNIVTNNVDGGYAAPSIFIPLGCVQYSDQIDLPRKDLQKIQNALKPLITELTCTNLVKRAYSDPDPIARKVALVTMAILNQDAPYIDIVNVGGRISITRNNCAVKPRSKREILQLEELARTEWDKRANEAT